MSHSVERITRYVYIIIFTAIVFVSVFLALSSEYSSRVETSAEGTITFSDCWFTSDGNHVDDISRLNLLPYASEVIENRIYAKLPEKISENVSLCFRAKHIYFSVYIDDENIYSQNLPENRLYTNSNGADWIFVPLLQEYAGKKIEIRYRVCYEESTCGFDYVKISPERGMVLNVINEKLFGFIVSIFYIVVSFILIIIDIPISIKLNKSHSFLYLGLITLTVSLYSLVESQLFQLFIGNERIMHLLSCYSLILIPIPMILYTNSMFPFENKYIVSVFSTIHLIIFIILGAFNYRDIADYHDSMPIIHGFMLIAIFTMFATIIRHIVKKIKQQHNIDKYLKFEIIGLFLLIVTGLIDLFRYYLSDTTDPARYVRIGLLGFIVFYSASSCEKLISALNLSAQTKIISRLAYQDGLTGLFNRTAYNEKIEALMRSEKYIGICALDVNNLKKVNDNLGHDMGDKLIKKSAEIISDAFEGTNGIPYRIGGDEFIVIVYGERSEQTMKKAMERVSDICGDFNRKGEYPFEIHIACGSSVYNGTGSIDDTMKNADRMMYENKRLMKSGQAIA